MHLVFCFLSVFFIVGFTDANIRVKSFKYKDDHKADGRDILQNRTVSSAAKCAYQCTANKDCEDANYNRVSKFCQLLRKKTESVMLSLVEQTGYIYLGDNDEIKKYDALKRVKMIKECSSCKTIYDSGRSNGNKAYNLTFGTSTNWSMTYCMMDPIPVCGSGGWTLVMKIDGTKQEFTYTSQHWSEKTAHNESAGQTGIDDLTETKMPSYWKTNFTKICLGMRRNNTGDVNWIKINMKAESLYSLLADGKEKETTALGRSAWVSLFPDLKLQSSPCKEGLNIVGSDSVAKVRIGFMADGGADCGDPNSAIGVGVENGAHLVPCGSSNTKLDGGVSTSNCFIFVQ